MRGVIMHGPGDVRVEDREKPTITRPTDAVIKLAATCICGSDLWPYRGVDGVDAAPMGHEYVGVVEEIGADVKNVKVGDFVVGSFMASDNTCEICQAGYQSRCVHVVPMGGIGTQSEYALIPHADGTLVATPGQPDPDLIPSLLAASDVLGTGWFAAVAAEVGPGKTVAVVGDGAVGLLGILAASQLGADRIIAMSRRRRPAGARTEVRRDRHRRRARRRRCGEDQGADERARRALGDRGRRHAGVHDAGDPLDASPAGTSDTSASRTTSPCPEKNCSSPVCTCTAVRPPCGASCPSSSS